MANAVITVMSYATLKEWQMTTGHKSLEIMRREETTMRRKAATD